MTRAGAYEIPGFALGFHFSRVTTRRGRSSRRTKFDAAAIIDQLERAAIEEQEVLDRELAQDSQNHRSTTRPR